MRTFIALDLPQSFHDQAYDLAQTLANNVQGRFMTYDTYHLTLAFMGEIDEAQSHRVIQVLDAISETLKAPVLHTVGLGKFGKSHDATLYLEIQATDPLLTLATTLRDQLQQADISFDAKKFRPHITLARRANLSRMPFEHLPFPASATAPKVTFYKSMLRPQGAEYKELYSIMLNE